ncbi:hypothetical protein G9C85_13830 [Halorubellus sp. JP-L1]|uniref:DUF7553 family protein n=1 Tax=Halorubellus sp. JP-L1 TaxID=2715753 RepID=UPI001409D84A|nr:hypothetical protein [Halorubellus sp. JP-L1]NHN42701.1 hypothetical protein [Halorubellus sp. JP-L1]
MDEDLAPAQAAIERAIERTDDPTLREHLRSLDEGLTAVATDGEAGDGTETDAKTQDEESRGDKLESIESELADVAGEADEVTRSHLETARDEIDEYRRANTRDW